VPVAADPSSDPSRRRSVWVLLETAHGRVAAAHWQLLGHGRALADSLGEDLVVVLLGPPGAAIRRAALDAFAYGGDAVIMMEDSALAVYDGDRFARAVAYLAAKYRPGTLLLAAGRDGDDLAARLAADGGTEALCDCVDLSMDGDDRRLAVVRSAPGGFVCRLGPQPGDAPQIATVRLRPGATPPQRSERVGHIVVEPLVLAERPADAPPVRLLPGTRLPLPV